MKYLIVGTYKDESWNVAIGDDLVETKVYMKKAQKVVNGFRKCRTWTRTSTYDPDLKFGPDEMTVYKIVEIEDDEAECILKSETNS